MKRLLGVLLGVLVLMVGTTTVFALDITVPDNHAHSGTPYGQDTSWWTNPGESQEVEPGNVTAPEWDLQRMLFDGTYLTIEGGYNFKDGVYSAGWKQWFTSGDIFLDITGDMKYGTLAPNAVPNLNLGTANGYKTITSNVFGYDYVLDLEGNTYTVRELNASSQFESVYFRSNDASGAYRYKSGAVGNVVATGTITYNATYTSMTVDLSFLQSIQQQLWFNAKYTMGCGNDDIIGHYDPVPEPGTLILLGGGLISLCAILRKLMF